MTLERPLLTHPDVQVFPSKAMFLGKTLFTSDIVSVSVNEFMTPGRQENKGMVYGGAAALSALLVVWAAFRGCSTGPSPLRRALCASPAILFGVGHLLGSKQKTVLPGAVLYTLVLDTVFGRLEAYTTDDQAAAHDIRAAIEQATSSRNQPQMEFPANVHILPFQQAT